MENKQPTEYTNRELAILISNLDDNNKIAHKEIKEELTEIKLLVKNTNGRVYKLEIWRSGIVAVIALLAFAIPLALNYFK